MSESESESEAEVMDLEDDAEETVSVTPEAAVGCSALRLARTAAFAFSCGLNSGPLAFTLPFSTLLSFLLLPFGPS